jgi:tetratricopeptide (TPR) repeat protein
MLQRLEDLDKSYGLSTRGLLEEERGNIPAAASYYYTSLELDPGRSSNNANLASLLARLDLADEAHLVSPDSADDIAFFMSDWETAIQMARENLDQEPESIDALADLFFALALSGDIENAQPLAEKLWDSFDGRPLELGDTTIYMSWIATKTEHAKQADIYREAGAKWLQARIESGDISRSRYINEAILATIDGRDIDAINAIAMAIDNGSRWQYFLEYSMFDRLKDNVRFQTQVSRMNDLVNTERSEVLAMLCGPETILNSWKPAVTTCEIYRQEMETKNG